MQFIFNVFIVVGALTFIVAGITGNPAPFGAFVPHNLIVRVIEVMIGISILFTFKK